MSEPLYNREILRLAASTASLQRLDEPDATAEKRSPLCGSRVTIDLALSDGRVAAVGADVRACAFGQASAALLANGIVGQSAEDLSDAREALQEYLAGRRDNPGHWPGLAVFDRARAHPGRHAAILLPFDAATEAALLAMGRP
jgi:NifU-like protein involved in Fe-S cluster formation